MARCRHPISITWERRGRCTASKGIRWRPKPVMVKREGTDRWGGMDRRAASNRVIVGISNLKCSMVVNTILNSFLSRGNSILSKTRTDSKRWANKDME